ncbi:DUF1320 domain-containing protein [Conchiformibius steedae DSM 2580]|uniref:DUF1320 domain-containing protein n=1 Tax=Conchiformibius steedae DSM 2580 TaxID=1121352 RepID=A0AAE9KZQ6_9NEIS|nr:phage protein Gp36 family protein [Conchiformibius steedae]URD68108.1 DUF1320 domain-containing protein [Conchiformibius steedae DSM 2580]
MITRQDMIDRFGEGELIKLTDRTHRRAIDDAVLDKAMADAAAEAGSYLSAAGFVRLPPTPPRALTVKACDIARFYLYENGTSGIVQKRYDEAVKWLKEVVKNPAMLGLDALPETKQTGVVVVVPNQPVEWRDV